MPFDPGKPYIPKYTKKAKFLNMLNSISEEAIRQDELVDARPDELIRPLSAFPNCPVCSILHQLDSSPHICIKERKFSWHNFVTSKWCATSKSIIEASENGILSCLNTNFKRRYVNISSGLFGNQEVKIWTLSLNESSKEIPIVLIHGFASGLALWALNLDALAHDRPVYAIDLPGFARSSRPKFDERPEEVEIQYIHAIEEWRIEMNLSNFILLGHSMGAFLSTAYSIHFPERVQHLVLAEPWGFKEKPSECKGIASIPSPIFTIMRFLEPLNVNPLWSLRLLGRMGPHVIQFFRSELVRSFKPEVPNAEKLVSNYICQCNTQEPTGEAAFTTLMRWFGWAKNPMINRIHLLQHDLPVTVIYGGGSWIDHVTLEELQMKRGISTLIDLHILDGTGHHVYTNKNTLHLFNKIVVHACCKVRAPFQSPRQNEEEVNAADSEIQNTEGIIPEQININAPESFQDGAAK